MEPLDIFIQLVRCLWNTNNCPVARQLDIPGRENWQGQSPITLLTHTCPHTPSPQQCQSSKQESRQHRTFHLPVLNTSVFTKYLAQSDKVCNYFINVAHCGLFLSFCYCTSWKKVQISVLLSTAFSEPRTFLVHNKCQKKFSLNKGLQNTDSSGIFPCSAILLIIAEQSISQSEGYLDSFLNHSQTNILMKKRSKNPTGLVQQEAFWLCRLWQSKSQESKKQFGKRDSKENSHRLYKPL